MDPADRHATTCWECGGVHVWSKRWAEFVETERETVDPL